MQAPYSLTLSSPLGPLRIWASAEEIYKIDFVTEDWHIDVPSKLCRDAEGKLRSYFAGDQTPCDLPLHFALSPFENSVLEAVCMIPYGKTASYSDIALQIGNPRAQRAVGNCVRKNPFAILVPCHRVIRSNGELGCYYGGPIRKMALLKLEGATWKQSA